MYINNNGFTMVEMVVTLLIIITLSLLSFPLYEGRNTDKSKLAEGYALVGTIINAQIAYYNEYGYFLHYRSLRDIGVFTSEWGTEAFTAYDPILGINAINNRYFTWFNAYGTNDRKVIGEYAYHITAIARSAKAGTVSLEYNLTKKSEPVVSGI